MSPHTASKRLFHSTRATDSTYMAAIFRSQTLYSFSSLNRHTKECVPSRLQTCSILSRCIMKHKFQRHNFLHHETYIEHCGQKPRASSDENKNTATEAPFNSDSEVKQTSDKKVKAKEVGRGQVTAILTGAIAVLLGVGYLILVQILDSRGIVLQPPPPEAFDP